jgi:hypothetical protein
MTLTSGGLLLIGTTSTTPAFGTSSGVNISPVGESMISGGNNTTLFLNRTTGSGSIMDFRLGGSQVGSIGTSGSALVLGNGNAGFYFNSSLSTVMPWNITNNTNSDAGIDIGQSANRFKDLYLSSGVYLGGTGAANKLDDYEEGTWTPYISVGTHSYSQQQGKYTKIGNQVTVWARMIVSSRGSSGSELGIAGLPFTSGGSPYASTFGMSNTYGQAGLLPAAVTPTGGSIEGSIAYLRNQWRTNSSYTVDDTNTSGGFTVAFTYRTS